MTLPIRRSSFFGPSFFEDFLGSDFSPMRSGADFNVRVDIQRTEKGLVLTAEVPGLNEEDINLEYENGVLTLSGEKKIKQDRSEENQLVREISYGKFMRTFRLGKEIEQEELKANLDNGLLTVTLPFAEKEKAKRIPINSPATV